MSRGSEQAARRRAARLASGDLCSEAGCPNPRASLGLCKTHYNKANGYYVGDVAKDPERERARLRIKTHRRKATNRLTDITPEYEIGLRAKTKRCPLCRVRLTDLPYLPTSKELDHLIPQSVGGTHTMGNVRIICRTCNLARPKDGSDYAGPVTLWAIERGFVPTQRHSAKLCEHGVKTSSRCLDCRPLKSKPRAANGQRPTHCLDCGVDLHPRGGAGRPRKYCTVCRPPTYVTVCSHNGIDAT